MSRFTRSAILAGAIAALGAAAPVAGALFGDDVARKQIADQQKQIDALYQYHQQLTERLARAEEALKNQPVMALASQIEALREDMRQLRGQIEVVSHNIDMAAKRQRDMYVDLDTRLRRLEQAAANSTPPAAPPEAPPPAGAPPGTGMVPPPGAAGAAVNEEGRAYEAAQQQRRGANYPAAIAAFQAFLAQFPKSALAPRAQYWIGDSYYNLRDYKSAIASQQKLVSIYPDSSSVPDALLNMASAQIELGDGGAARRTMDSLVARFPASEAAEKAKRRLATLR